VAPPSSPLAPSLKSDLPIALHKGTCCTRNPLPHYIAISYHRLSPSLFTCLSSISSLSIPKTISDAFAHLGWKQTIIVELCVLQNSGTWDIVPLPSGKVVVGCK